MSIRPVKTDRLRTTNRPNINVIRPPAEVSAAAAAACGGYTCGGIGGRRRVDDAVDDYSSHRRRRAPSQLSSPRAVDATIDGRTTAMITNNTAATGVSAAGGNDKWVWRPRRSGRLTVTAPASTAGHRRHHDDEPLDTVLASPTGDCGRPRSATVRARQWQRSTVGSSTFALVAVTLFLLLATAVEVTYYFVFKYFKSDR